MVRGRCLLICLVGSLGDSKSGVLGRRGDSRWLGELDPGGQGADLLGTPGDVLLRGTGLGTTETPFPIR